jgi:hypothetical protein
VISRPYIAPFHIRNTNLELKNLFSVVSHRRTENTFNSILLFVEIHFILSKANKNIIININRWDHSNVRFFNRKILVQFGGLVFQQTIGIPMGRNCALLLVDLFLPTCFWGSFPAMEFTFHSSYVILECVLSTVIFWTELYCWHKSYSNRATLLLRWSNRYKQSTVVITIWLTVTKYPYHNFKWQWILYSLRTCLPIDHCQDIDRTLRFPHSKLCSFRFYLKLISYLRYVCLLAYICVQHILCCSFVLYCLLLVCSMCHFLVCPLLISPSVFSNVYFIAKSCNLMLYY